jgi:hypothetical protein
MPVHDWARVSAGTYHDFHSAWILHLKEALNDGLLPAGYYAQSEQHVGGYIADVLTLQAGPSRLQGEPDNGTTAVAAPPRVSRKLVAVAVKRGTPRTIAIRHTSGHRVVALIEIVSTANKDRAKSVQEFVAKAQGALQVGCHLLIIDVLPAGRFDPRGMHAALWKFYDRKPYKPPADKPLTLAAYVSKPLPEAYLEHIAVGAGLPKMPLFLTAQRHIDIPLEPSYMAAYRGIPAIWRDVLEGRSKPGA